MDLHHDSEQWIDGQTDHPVEAGSESLSSLALSNQHQQLNSDEAMRSKFEDRRDEHFCRLFVGGLKESTSPKALKKYFSKWGQVVDTVVLRNKKKKSRGFGFVTYKSSSMLEAAFDACPHTIDDKEVEIDRTKPREVRIPLKKLGHVIGKDGETVKMLRSQTGARIQIKPVEDDAPFRICVITGVSANVQKAVDAIADLLDHDEYEMLIPKDSVEAVMGKGGRVIDGIKAETGTEIYISKESCEPTKVLCTVSGKPYFIEVAVSMIQELVEFDEAKKYDLAHKLFVGGLDHETTEATLKEYFSTWGEVEECVLMRRQGSTKSRRFGFITYSEPAMLDAALNAAPHTIDGKEVGVNRPVHQEEDDFYQDESIAGQEEYMETDETENIAFVQGIPAEYALQHLKELFHPHEHIKRVHVVKSKPGCPTKVAFMQFDSFSNCGTFIKTYNGKHIPETEHLLLVRLSDSTEEQSYNEGDIPEIEQKKKPPRYSVQMRNIPAGMTWLNLRDALKPLPDHIDISMKKTQKGSDTVSAFIHLKSLEACARFVQRYDGQILSGTQNRILVKPLCDVSESGQPKLYICGLPYAVTQAHLSQLCRQYGKVKHCKVVQKEDKPFASAIVTMNSIEECREAISALNDTYFPGSDCIIKVEFATGGGGVIKQEFQTNDPITAGPSGYTPASYNQEREFQANDPITAGPSGYTPAAYNQGREFQTNDPITAGPSGFAPAAYNQGREFQTNDPMITAPSSYAPAPHNQGREFQTNDLSTAGSSSYTPAAYIHDKEKYPAYVTGIPAHIYKWEMLKDALTPSENILHVKLLPLKPGYMKKAAIITLNSFNARERLILAYSGKYLPGTNDVINVERYNQPNGPPGRTPSQDKSLQKDLPRGNVPSRVAVQSQSLQKAIPWGNVPRRVSDQNQFPQGNVPSRIPGSDQYLQKDLPQGNYPNAPNVFSMPSGSSQLQDNGQFEGASANPSNVSSMPADPNQVDINEKFMLQIRGLPEMLQNKKSIHDMCSKRGVVKKVQIVKDQMSGKIIAYVTMMASIDCRSVIRKLDGTVPPGGTEALKVEMAQKLSAAKSDLSETATSGQNVSVQSQREQLMALVGKLSELKEKQQGQLNERMNALQANAAANKISPNDPQSLQQTTSITGTEMQAQTELFEIKRREMLEAELQKKEQQLQMAKKLELLKAAEEKQERLKKEIEEKRLARLEEERIEQINAKLLEEARKRQEKLQEELQRKEQELMGYAEQLEQFELQGQEYQADLEGKALEAEPNLESQLTEAKEWHLAEEEEQGMEKGIKKRKHQLAENVEEDISSSTSLEKEGKKLKKSSGEDVELVETRDQEVDNLGAGVLAQAILAELKNLGIKDIEMVPEILDFIGDLPIDCLRVLADSPVELLRSFSRVNPVQILLMSQTVPQLNSLMQQINLDRLIALLQAVGPEAFHSLANQFLANSNLLLDLRGLFSKLMTLTNG